MTVDPLHEVRRAVLRAAAAHQPGERVLIGVSGGADSVTLAAVAAGCARETGVDFGAAVIDHQLQPGSDAVAAAAAQQCRALGLAEVFVARVDVDGGPGAGGLENAARNARRARLRELAARWGAPAVWLAHTRDDQAETVLLGLLRGSGARSLAGMRERDDIWERPLLGIDRSTVRAALEQLGLAAHADPHNDDPRFARVRVRQAVLPVMQHELGGHIVGNLARTADLLRDDADALDAIAAAWLVDHPDLQLVELAHLHRAVRTRVLRAAVLRRGTPANGLTKEHIDALDHLVMDPRTTGPVALPGPLAAHKDRAAGVIVLR